MVDSAPAPHCSPRADGYERHLPEETLLYRVVREHWPSFLERAEEHGGLPEFVTREFEAYLRCGILEHGLVHLACRGCGEDMVVAFSCKRRGFCPSCLGRRMADVAAHLTDEVFPEVPVRQWVCSLPWRLRYLMGYDRRLCADVLEAFVSALSRSLSSRAEADLGLGSASEALSGAVTFIQRSDSALRLNVHFHTLALDGVYVRDEVGALVFHSLGTPTPEEVHQVAAWTHEALLNVLKRHGRSAEGHEAMEDPLHTEQPVLASCYGASAGDQQLFGPGHGRRTDKLVQPIQLLSPPIVEPLAEVGGVNIQAKVVVPGHDRSRLERLCRYVARPPLATDRLESHGDGRLRYRFKAPWKDGTEAVLLHPMDLLSRLCALVPAPRFHMLRYHGVLAGRAKARAEVTPGPSPKREEQLPLLRPEDGGPAPPKAPSRQPWATLLARVFSIDLETCPRCGQPMRLLEVVTDPEDVRRILGRQPRRARAPPRASPDQLSFAFTLA